MASLQTIRRVSGFAVAMMVVAAAGAPPHADVDLELICPLLLHQQRVDLEERELDVELVAADFAAAESIYDLVRRLWEGDATERLLYLRAKRDRDLAELELKRSQLLVIRDEAELEQYEVLCGDADEDAGDGDRIKRIDEARRRYIQADCHRIGKDLAIAEVSLAYDREWLVSVRELRAERVAAAQDVILAERNVKASERRVARHGRRVQACIASGDAGDGDGGS